MARLVWDQTGEKTFEAGVDHCALYTMKDALTGAENTGAAIYNNGVAWNGITAITEGREGGEPNNQWADNIKYISLSSAEEFNPTIEAFTYPDEFAECDGSKEVVSGFTLGQQKRKAFALAYRTKIGNDTQELDYGYKLHVVYNIKAQPSERAYETLNDSPEGMTFSWECSTTPIDPNYENVITGARPTAHVEIDSTKFTTEAAKAKFAQIETALFGGENAEAHVLLPYEIAQILAA